MNNLITTEAVANILGVTRSRVWQLAESDNSFPRPAWRGRVEVAWDRTEIDAWAATNGYPRSESTPKRAEGPPEHHETGDPPTPRPR